MTTTGPTTHVPPTSGQGTPSGLASGPGDEAEEGLYGPRGWTVRAGVWPLLLQCPDHLRSALAPGSQGRGPRAGLDAHGAPQEDYVPFLGLDADQAAQLVGLLPQAALSDRQNLAPPLGSLLRACAGAGERMLLSGYGIGPQRHDERVTVEALWVSDEDLLGYEVTPVHGAGCHCHELWRQVRERYGLDAECVPDELRLTRPTWADGRQGWWMWWD